MEYALVFGAGVISGAALALLINWIRRSHERELARHLVYIVENQRVEDLERILGRVRESFQALSMEALSRSTSEFLKLATQSLGNQTRAGEKDLEGKKRLIDEKLELMKWEMQRVRDLISALERDREQKFGEVVTQIRHTADETRKLQNTANQLHMALAGTKVRGQWGERMTEDVLSLLGLKEGINYRKQKALEGSATIPDFTFFLPEGQMVNMDVKFPMDNYLRYLATDSVADKEKYRAAFLKDVRNRIKEVSNRNYINPNGGTIDCMIIFIPNEQLFLFVNELDHKLIDDALRSKVILCSPVTLFAVLSVIRQAVVNFQLEKATGEIVKQFGIFNKQWSMFIASFDRLGKKIDETQSEYQALVSARARQLDKPLAEIQRLREGFDSEA